MVLRNPMKMAMLLITANNPSYGGRKYAPQISAAGDVLRHPKLTQPPHRLFPKSIFGFSVDPASGDFRRHLQSPSHCDTVFETHLLYEYDITGRINYGRISNLTGILAQDLFLWLPAKGIQVDIPSSGLIYFDVEVVSKQFSLSLFDTLKNCSSTEDVDGYGDLLKIPQV